MSSVSGRLLLSALILGAVIRAVLLPLPGTGDVGSWKSWSFQGSRDTTGLYGVGGTPTERGLIRWNDIVGTTEYPPLALYEMSAVGHVYRRVDRTYTDSPGLSALIKTPGLIAELAFVLVMLTWGARTLGARPARWIALAFWLNPAVILNGSALGYLDAQLFRAVRLVVDTGLHSKRWTRERAIQYMLDNTGSTTTEVETEVERYIVWPGQALGYMVGRLKLLELREKAKRALGDRFDLRKLHDVVLLPGALPLSLLEQEVDRWIESETNAGS